MNEFLFYLLLTKIPSVQFLIWIWSQFWFYFFRFKSKGKHLLGMSEIAAPEYENYKEKPKIEDVIIFKYENNVMQLSYVRMLINQWKDISKDPDQISFFHLLAVLIVASKQFECQFSISRNRCCLHWNSSCFRTS